MNLVTIFFNLIFKFNNFFNLILKFYRAREDAVFILSYDSRF